MNDLATQIARVAAGRRIAIVSSFSFPECRNQKLIMSRLIIPWCLSISCGRRCAGCRPPTLKAISPNRVERPRASDVLICGQQRKSFNQSSGSNNPIRRVFGIRRGERQGTNTCAAGNR